MHCVKLEGSIVQLADGRSIYFFEQGAGEPFLYAHASSGNADWTRPLVEQLKDRFRCISLDRVGYRHLSLEARNQSAADFLASDYRAGWEAFATEMSVVVNWSPTPAEWTQITQPTLVIAGDRTDEALQAVAAKVAERLPHGELETLAGLDHMAPLSQGAPDVVAQRTVAFIDRVVAAESKDSLTM